MLTISKKCSPSSAYSACVGIGNALVVFKTIQWALLSNECPSIFCSYIMFLTEGRWKVSLEWTSIDLFSKLSLTCEDNAKYYKIVYHAILTLSVRKGNTLEIFKINQEALPSIECPDIYPSWPNRSREEGLFWRVQGVWSYCEIILKSSWLS